MPQNTADARNLKQTRNARKSKKDCPIRPLSDLQIAILFEIQNSNGKISIVELQDRLGLDEESLLREIGGIEKLYPGKSLFLWSEEKQGVGLDGVRGIATWLVTFYIFRKIDEHYQKRRDPLTQKQLEKELLKDGDFQRYYRETKERAKELSTEESLGEKFAIGLVIAWGRDEGYIKLKRGLIVPLLRIEREMPYFLRALEAKKNLDSGGESSVTIETVSEKKRAKKVRESSIVAQGISDEEFDAELEQLTAEYEERLGKLVAKTKNQDHLNQAWHRAKETNKVVEERTRLIYGLPEDAVVTFNNSTTNRNGTIYQQFQALVRLPEEKRFKLIKKR
jgi:hypothetical protein